LAVHRAGVEDASRVSAILTEAATWLIETGRPQWPVESVGVAAVAPVVARGEAYLGVVDGDDVATWFLNAEDSLWWPELGDDDDSRFLHKLAIRRRAAGTGVATSVITWAIDETRRAGCRYLRLDCLDRSAVRSLYERSGFVLHDKRTMPYWDELACRYVLEVG
jgi:GNAT superfamily N-acetyltransferase